MYRTSTVLLCGGLACGGGASVSQSVSQGVPQLASEAGPVTPLIDHHQHLLSPATAAFWNGEPERPAELSAGVRELFRQRELAFGDSARLAAIYVEDAQLLHNAGGPTAARGRGVVAATVASLFGSPYRITPLAVARSSENVRITGYLSRGEADAPRHFGHISATLVPWGQSWRIAGEALVFPGPSTNEPLTAADLVRLLDDAGIQRALVLSVAYTYGGARRPRTADEYDRVRAENDWVAAQVAQHPDRLKAFCGFNPLSSYAIQELERCHAHPHLSGIKMHFANSGVDLREPDHVERVRAAFAAANERRMPIVAHVRTNTRMPYGAEFSRIFIERVLPAAPDIPIQIAHLAGSGPGYTDPPLDSALAVFAEARAAGDPRTSNLWFDVTSIVNLAITPQDAARVAQRIRQIGVERVLYGSDMAIGGNLVPRQGWALFRGLLPLTESEIRTIAANVAPYMR